MQRFVLRTTWLGRSYSWTDRNVYTVSFSTESLQSLVASCFCSNPLWAPFEAWWAHNTYLAHELIFLRNQSCRTSEIPRFLWVLSGCWYWAGPPHSPRGLSQDRLQHSHGSHQHRWHLCSLYRNAAIVTGVVLGSVDSFLYVGVIVYYVLHLHFSFSKRPLNIYLDFCHHWMRARPNTDPQLTLE